MKTIDDIPDEILCLIFSFLDVKTLRCVSLVGERFYTLSKIDWLWLSPSKSCTIVQPKEGVCICNKQEKKHKKALDKYDKSGCCLKEKCRLSTYWAREACYLDKILVGYRKKQRPSMHIGKRSLWVSEEQSVNYYEFVGKRKLRKFHNYSKQYPLNGLYVHDGICQFDVTKFVYFDELIYAAHRNGDICIWSKDLNTPIVVKKIHSQDINSLCVVKNIVSSVSDDKTIKVSQFNEETLLDGVTMFTGERNWSVCLSSDARNVICGSAGNTVSGVEGEPLTIWDIENKKKINSFSTAESGIGVFDIKLDSDKTFISTGYDGITRLWDLRCNLHQSVQNWEEPFGYSVYCLDTDRCNALFTGTARHGMVRFWDRRNTSKHIQIYFVGRKDTPVYCLDFDESSLYAAVDHSVHQLDFTA